MSPWMPAQTSPPHGDFPVQCPFHHGSSRLIREGLKSEILGPKTIVPNPPFITSLSPKGQFLLDHKRSLSFKTVGFYSSIFTLLWEATQNNILGLVVLKMLNIELLIQLTNSLLGRIPVQKSWKQRFKQMFAHHVHNINGRNNSSIHQQI